MHSDAQCTASNSRSHGCLIGRAMTGPIDPDKARWRRRSNQTTSCLSAQVHMVQRERHKTLPLCTMSVSAECVREFPKIKQFQISYRKCIVKIHSLIFSQCPALFPNPEIPRQLAVLNLSCPQWAGRRIAHLGAVLGTKVAFSLHNNSTCALCSSLNRRCVTKHTEKQFNIFYILSVGLTL